MQCGCNDARRRRNFIHLHLSGVGRASYICTIACCSVAPECRVSWWCLQLSDADETGSAVAAGIIAVCEQLIEHSPRMKITLLAVLPRGNREVEAPAAKVLIPNK